MKPSSENVIQMKEECTSVVAWEQASGWGKREKIGSGRRGGGGNRGRSTSAFPMSLPHATSSRFLAPFPQTQSLFTCYIGNTSIQTDVFCVSLKILKDKSTLTNLFNYSFYSDEGIRMIAEKPVF